MTDIDRRLTQLLRAHAPGMTSAKPGSALAALGPDLELGGDLSFDVIALTELTLAIEDDSCIHFDAHDVATCRTVRDLRNLLADELGQHSL